ncbi:MAG: inositol monophosphatase family protein [Acidimicrobiales bacterium]
MDTPALTRLLDDAADLARATLATISDLSSAGERPGQYAFDLAVDGPLIDLLHGAGLGVLSEEAGELDLDRELVAVLDPVDGSTNASRGIPWSATSICVVDDSGPLQSLVLDLASGTRFAARRGEGATRDGIALAPPPRVSLVDSVIGINGVPPGHGGWAQFRALGASALDLCGVAAGTLHGYVDFDDEAHGVWDYLGALLVCREVGLEIIDVFDRELIVLDHAARRTPVVAADPAAQEALRQTRLAQANLQAPTNP